MTAEEIIKEDQSGVYNEQDIAHMMIKFAKYHVEQALKQASNKMKSMHHKTTVLTAYSIENIK